MIVKSAIDLNKNIHEIMINRAEIKSIKLDSMLNQKKAKRLAKEGFSRIPVFKGECPIGILLVKSLIGLDLGNEGVSLSDLVWEQKILLRKPMFCSPDTSILEMLNKFKEGRSHLALITDNPTKMESFIESEEDLDESLFQNDFKV